MAMANGNDEYKAVFVETNLNTHFAVSVLYSDTCQDLKRKLVTQHSKWFGEIEIQCLKVERNGKLYVIPDVMPITSVVDCNAAYLSLFAQLSRKDEAVDHKTKLLTGPNIPLRIGYQTILQTDNLSGDFNNDDNVKSSSSHNDKEQVGGLLTQVSPVRKSFDVGSVEKKKRKVATHVHAVEIGSVDKDLASHKLHLQIKQENESFQGVRDVGVTESEAERVAQVPKLGMPRPLKRKKTGDDLHDATKMDGVGDEKPGRLTSKKHAQTQKPKRNIKQKQTPKSAVEKDDKAVAQVKPEKNDEMVELPSLSQQQIDIAVAQVKLEKNDEMVLPSSSQEEQIDIAVASVADANAADSKNDLSLGKDTAIAPAQVPLNAAKNKGSEETSSGSKHLGKSTHVVQQHRSKDSSTAKRHIIFKSKAAMKTKDSGFRPTDLYKRLHQVETTKEGVHNPPEKRSLISKPSSFFNDEISSSSEDEGGRDAADSSTETAYVSSDCSEDESRRVSPKHGNLKNGGKDLDSESIPKKMTMESILRGSEMFKKAKVVATELQLLDEESNSVVPDSPDNN